MVDVTLRFGSIVCICNEVEALMRMFDLIKSRKRMILAPEVSEVKFINDVLS